MSTSQEEIWAGSFGDAYIRRNDADKLLAAKTAFWAKIIANAPDINSVVELGANVGLNIMALRNLIPGLSATGVEINAAAHARLAQLPNVDAINGAIADYAPTQPADMAFTCGVLIHLNPEQLPQAYDTLYKASKRYIVVSEYYNPSPVSVPYRGQEDALFKRDWAGEMLDRFTGLRLIDYGFQYRRDPVFPMDDLTWFLMEKQ